MRLSWWRYLTKAYSASDAESEQLQIRINSSGGQNHDTYVSAEMSAIEGKSGVLLSHISMMIAITGILWALADKLLFVEVLFGFHLVAYLFLALLCIRCQMQFDTAEVERFREPVEGDATSGRAGLFRKGKLSELFFKEALFRFVLKCLYGLTGLLFATIAFSLFYDDVTALISGLAI